MGVRVVDNFRLSIQFVTLILAFVGVIEMFAIIHWRGPGWPLMIVPAVIALEIIAFYGWLVWLNQDGLAYPGASTRAIFMLGAGGHLVWVDPDLDAVVVTRWLDPAHTGTFVTMAADALRRA